MFDYYLYSYTDEYQAAQYLGLTLEDVPEPGTDKDTEGRYYESDHGNDYSWKDDGGF